MQHPDGAPFLSDTQQITPRILVSTDFTADSERAFYHALAFAVARQARLTLLHTGSESRDDVPWERFPGVRETLTVWGLLADDAPRTAVLEQLNLGVAKMAMRDDDPRQGITDYLRKHPTDLLVMATKGRSGLARMFRSSVAETVTHQTNSYALMLPDQGKGFVDPANGQARLDRVLVVLDPYRDSRPAMAYLKQWLPALGANAAEILVVHTAGQPAETELLLPQAGDQQWRQEIHNGTSADAAMEAAEAFQPDLVVMSTQGPLGLKARMRGSNAEKILRELHLPLLSIPSR